MKPNSNTALYVALAAVVIAVIACFLPGAGSESQTPQPGSITNGTNYKYGISVGNTASLGVVPTNFAKILAGSCSLIASTYTIAASSTLGMDCAVTGVVSTDLVFAESATSTAGFGTGWSITGASASSTANFITVTVSNGTGASGVIPASIASSTKYQVYGTQ